MGRSAVFLTLIALASPSAQTPLHSQTTGQILPQHNAAQTEEWVGIRTSGGRSQKIVLHLGQPGGERGTVDLPDFGALGIPAAKFELTKNHIQFELVGDASTAVFDGSVSRGEIDGHWTEGDRFGDFTLRRSTRSD